jgi:hypothetical protein
VRADVAAARASAGVIVAPGCVIRHPVDRALLADIVGMIAKGAP